MTERIVPILSFVAALGSGLMAGLFFVFSFVIMTAFSRLSPANGVAAMNSINVTILNGVFLSVFLGTALISVLLIFAWFMGAIPSPSVFVLTASLLYLVGVIGVTMVFNVPMNDALGAVQPDSAEAAGLWQDYLSRWTMWNHVRTFSGLGSLALFILALRG